MSSPGVACAVFSWGRTCCFARGRTFCLGWGRIECTATHDDQYEIQSRYPHSTFDSAFAFCLLLYLTERAPRANPPGECVDCACTDRDNFLSRKAFTYAISCPEDKRLSEDGKQADRNPQRKYQDVIHSPKHDHLAIIRALSFGITGASAFGTAEVHINLGSPENRRLGLPEHHRLGLPTHCLRASTRLRCLGRFFPHPKGFIYRASVNNCQCF